MKTVGGYKPNLLLFQARRLKRKLKKDTQMLRQRLLEELENMFQIAKQYVQEAEKDPNKARQCEHWIRVMGYLGQVMNSLADSFDEAKALEYLQNLERKIREAEGHSQTGSEA